jgi:hypothetical protein
MPRNYHEREWIDLTINLESTSEGCGMSIFPVLCKPISRWCIQLLHPVFERLGLGVYQGSKFVSSDVVLTLFLYIKVTLEKEFEIKVFWRCDDDENNTLGTLP